MHGAKVVMVAAAYAGDPGDAGPVLAPLAQLGTPLLDLSATVPYVDAQSALDAAFPAGDRYYFKSHFLQELSDQAIEAMLTCDAARPTSESLMIIRSLGGAISRVAPEDGAYPHRNARYNLSVDAAWTDPALDAAAIGWARSAWDALRPFGTGRLYVNFAGLGEGRRPHRRVRAGSRASPPDPDRLRPRRHLRRRRRPAMTTTAGHRMHPIRGRRPNSHRTRRLP